MEQVLDPLMEIDTFPTVCTFKHENDLSKLKAWYQDNKLMINNELLRSGAIVFKGANINSVEKFEEFTGSIASKFRNYLDGNYPRKNLKGHVYISTEYDANYDITMHNELSYSHKWPSMLFLSCVIPPEEGGETPLVDSRRIVDVMNPDILKEFERRNIRYIRNLHDGEGMGPSWQETFSTLSRTIVEQHCKNIDIRYTWKDDGGLKLENIRPATRLHPLTGEKVWFNQVDQYHPSHFPKETYETLILLAGEDEENLPLFVSYGDGGKIPETLISEVINTIDKIVVVRPWNEGDFLMVDNMLVAHGRKAYKGDRKIIVAMAE